MKNEKWNAENIPDQSGRIAIVTGSSSGIGFEAARVLANKKATVIIAVRNLKKGYVAVEKIRAQNSDAKVEVMQLDLADLSSVEEFATEFAGKYSRLDLLINNAGVMIPPYSKTVNGFELQFGTNHLGHFALTARLLPILNQTAGARIVNVSSGAHKQGKLDFDDLNWEKRKYSAWRAYGASKIANLYFTYELDRKLKANGSKTIVTAAHPGWTATELQRHTGVVEALNSVFAQGISMGALPTLRAAVEPGLKGGEYFGPNGFMEMRGNPVPVPSNALSHDGSIARQLWEYSLDATGVRFPLGQMAASAA
ncbi:MAG: SDR family NAD(P)-dependent oxidoreductase [Pyrinomonadaceae bacterium]